MGNQFCEKHKILYRKTKIGFRCPQCTAEERVEMQNIKSDPAMKEVDLKANTRFNTLRMKRMRKRNPQTLKFFTQTKASEPNPDNVLGSN
jgi:hypothetical protein